MLLHYGYAIFSILGYSAGLCVFFVIARNNHRSLIEIIEIGLVAVFSSLFGAKIFHTLFEAPGHSLPNGKIAQGVLDLLYADPWHWARLFSHGHVFFGGLACATVIVAALLRLKNIDRPLQYADFFTPGLALGLSLGRLGCFFAGCCYGQTSEIPWLTIQYPGHLAEMGSVIPVQLFESFFSLCCFIYLLYKNNKNSQDGFLFFWFLGAYSIFRFLIEFLRADSDRGLWLDGAISTSQIISLIILFSLGYYSIAFTRKVKVKLS